MLLGEPAPTQADLHFHLLGVPVRVHPLFWVMSVVFGMNLREPVLVALWVLAVFLSVLVHEMGHALAIRNFGGHPWITLYSLGGLASNNERFDPKRHIQILFAGPGAGFLFAAVIVAILWSAGHAPEFMIGWPYVIAWIPDFELMLDSPRLATFIEFLLFVNIWWGLINLLPVFPLDGGQIARDTLLMTSPRDGLRTSLWLSVITGAVVTVYAVQNKQPYLALMFGFMAWQSYSMIGSYFGSSGGR